MPTKGLRAKMRLEVNDYLQRFRAVRQEGIMLLVDDLAEALGAKGLSTAGGLAEGLNGKTTAELVDPSLLEEWQEFVRQLKLDYIDLERVRSNLQLRLSESARRTIIVDPNEAQELNFSFSIPSLPVHPRPALSLVRSN